MTFDVQYTNRFLKDLKLAKKRKLNTNLLRDVIEKLRTGQKLDNKYHDHQLSGDYANYRECHIQPDWLLVYKIEMGIMTLTLMRTGTHSDLF
ncbi:MAG: type II toxin-antitoxin system YafQ family toxin [Selenomonas sp.]|jgi:mRNA interferase YafQ|nr:type II toxin-antitoxin system YafQ family toxin [Selenomonas sp.]